MSIIVKDLKYTYSPGMPGETLALDGVSFEIEDGCVCGIIGHTGSGKSTLLQTLDGLIRPQEGEISIGDVVITDPKTRLVDIRRRVGLVFQYPEYQLFEETVARDVAFGPKNLGLTETEIAAAVKESIELVGLDYESIRDKSPFELSGGQKRRVAIAGVIAMNPEILILDEPTAGLDPTAHRDILDMVRRIHDTRGISIILVSHNMGDVADMCDKVLVMDEGRIMLEGTPEEVFAHSDELNEVGLAVPPAAELFEAVKQTLPELTGRALNYAEAAQLIADYIKKKES